MSNQQLTKEQLDQLSQYQSEALMWNAEIKILQGIANEKRQEYLQSLNQKWYNSAWRAFFLNAANLAQNELLSVQQNKANAFRNWQSVNNPSSAMIAIAQTY